MDDKDKIADEYVNRVMDEAPDVLSPGHIVNIMGFLITSYAANKEEAAGWLTFLVRALGAYYSSDDETMH